MIDFFEPAAIVFLLLFALVQLFLALSAARLPLRIHRLPKHGAGHLPEGPVQVSGRLEAVDTSLTTLDGTSVASLETLVVAPSRRDYPLSVQRWGRMAVADGTGTAQIDVDRVILVGEARRTVLDNARFREQFPGLAADVSPRFQNAPAFTIEQRFIAVGQDGFVAGEAAPDVRSPEAGYRGGSAPPIVIAAGVNLPLIVAGRSRGAVLGYLLAPALRHVIAAVFALVLALVVFGVDHFIASAAGG